MGLAVLLPTAALIYVNFSQLSAFECGKVLEAAIHCDLQEMLAITEKKKAYQMAEESRDLFHRRTSTLQRKKRSFAAMFCRRIDLNPQEIAPGAKSPRYWKFVVASFLGLTNRR